MSDIKNGFYETIGSWRVESHLFDLRQQVSGIPLLSWQRLIAMTRRRQRTNWAGGYPKADYTGLRDRHRYFCVYDVTKKNGPSHA